MNFAVFTVWAIFSQTLSTFFFYFVYRTTQPLCEFGSSTMLRSALSLWFTTKDPKPAMCSALPWKHLGRTTSLNVGFPSYCNTWSSTWIEMVNPRVGTHTDVLIAQIPDSPLYSLIPSLSLYLSPVSRPPGVHQRGLFRLSGSVVRTRLLRQRWDRGEVLDLEQEGDVPTVASLLKLFLRELPGALVPEPQRKDLVASLAGKWESGG